MTPNPAWPTTEAEETEWRAIAETFLFDPEQSYLNTGSYGVMARSTRDALVAALEELELNPTRYRQRLEGQVAESRQRLARFVNAQAEDLAFLPNVTVAINAVISGLDWRPGDQIAVSDQEYGSINNCVHHATRRYGVELREAKIPIPPKEPDDIVRAFDAVVTDRTRLVLCSHITTGTGLIAPVKALADLAHERGAMILVDGAHGPGMIPLDLDGWGCDFYGGNCHKWLCSPKGVGFLHAAPHAQQTMWRLVVAWGYDRQESDGKTDEAGRPITGGAPYMWSVENWGTLALAERIATGEAVRLQEEIGRERVAARGRQLAGYLRDRMAEHDWSELITPTHPEMTGSMSAFRLHGFDGEALWRDLFERYRITVPVARKSPEPTVRVSTHIYTSFEQIDRFVEALVELRP